MVDFNPLPYSGYVDANNHFLNSFLGGIYIRLFGSDAMWVVRLPNLLAFPIYFWSIYGFRSFFKLKINFYAFLSLFIFSSFLIEYFGMARGYGLSLAFMMLGIQQLMMYVKEPKRSSIIVLTLAWMLAVFANLTLIPFAIFALLFVMVFSLMKKRYLNVAIPIIAFLPIVDLIKYSFFLKAEGKLYYGGQEGFFENTIHSLTPYLWGFSSFYFDISLVLLFLFILFSAVVRSSNSLRIFDPKIVFAIFLFLGVFNIIGQNWILGTNFPEDRSAIYLVVFFFGALVFTIDYWQTKYLGIPLILGTLLFFGLQSNVRYFQFFKYEHFDVELLSQIPETVDNTPPSTGGRFWLMDNERSRSEKMQTYVFQEASSDKDTLLDYIIIQKSLRPNITDQYHSIHKDPYSELELFKRNSFLKRTKIVDTTLSFESQQEYIDLMKEPTNSAVLVRISGVFYEMNIHLNPELIFLSKDLKTNKVYSYNGFSFIQSCFVNDKEELHFDFSVVLNDLNGSNELHLFLQNSKKQLLKGEFKLELYKIGE